RRRAWGGGGACPPPPPPTEGTVRAAEKIILPGDRDRLGCVTQIRVRATCQRDEFSLCTSKFESYHPSHAVGLCDIISVSAEGRKINGVGYMNYPDNVVRHFVRQA